MPPFFVQEYGGWEGVVYLFDTMGRGETSGQCPFSPADVLDLQPDEAWLFQADQVVVPE